MMTNYEKVLQHLKTYFSKKHIVIDMEKDMHLVSENDQVTPPVYLYNGSKKINVISMDDVAQKGYKVYKEAEGKPVNTVDAFLADADNDWYFIEFKDCKISSKKDNIEKKGMANFLMLADIFSSLGAGCKDIFEPENPMKFAREHIIYILVCSAEKDPYTYDQVRSSDTLKEKYTPPCLQKFKDYFFKDAYVYTEEYFEKRFVGKFEY